MRQIQRYKHHYKKCEMPLCQRECKSGGRFCSLCSTTHSRVKRSGKWKNATEEDIILEVSKRRLNDKIKFWR